MLLNYKFGRHLIYNIHGSIGCPALPCNGNENRLSVYIECVVCCVAAQWPTGYGQGQQSGQYQWSQWNPATAAQTWPSYNQQGNWGGYSGGQYQK